MNGECPDCGSRLVIIGVDLVCLNCGYSEDVDYDDVEDDDDLDDD